MIKNLAGIIPQKVPETHLYIVAVGDVLRARAFKLRERVSSGLVYPGRFPRLLSSLRIGLRLPQALDGRGLGRISIGRRG